MRSWYTLENEESVCLSLFKWLLFACIYLFVSVCLCYVCFCVFISVLQLCLGVTSSKGRDHSSWSIRPVSKVIPDTVTCRIITIRNHSQHNHHQNHNLGKIVYSTKVNIFTAIRQKWGAKTIGSHKTFKDRVIQTKQAIKQQLLYYTIRVETYIYRVIEHE